MTGFFIFLFSFRVHYMYIERCLLFISSAKPFNVKHYNYEGWFSGNCDFRDTRTNENVHLEFLPVSI